MPKQDSGWARRADVHQQMADMMFGHCVSQTIRAVADVSLADHLADGPLTAAEVAERENSAPTTIFRLMRACVALGLLSSERSIGAADIDGGGDSGGVDHLHDIDGPQSGLARHSV
jgi:hypothetical protein